MIEDNAAPAAVTKKTLAVSITVIRVMLKIFSLMGCIGFFNFIIPIKKQIACQ